MKIDNVTFASVVTWAISIGKYTSYDSEGRMDYHHVPSPGRYEMDDLQRIFETAAAERPVSGEDVIAMCQAMAANRKIDAIKLYRTLTGYGLKESKDAIEAAMGAYAVPMSQRVA